MITFRRPRASDLGWVTAAVCLLGTGFILVTTLGWVGQAYTALPFWDAWRSPYEYDRLRRGLFQVREYFIQNNEHRVVFTRLISFADYAFSHGDNRLNLTVSHLAQAAHAILLTMLLGGPWRRPLTISGVALIVGLLFCIGQYENLVWGFQTQFTAVYALATGGFILAAKAADSQGRRGWLSLAACALVFTVATFTMANGLVAVGIAAVLIFTIGGRRWMSAALLGLLTLLALAYFHNYIRVPENGAAADAISHPVAYVLFVLDYLGNPLGQLSSANTPYWYVNMVAHKLPVLLGLAGVTGCFMAAGLVVLRRGDDRSQAVLTAVMLFIGATASITAIGRLNLGIDQADAPRYHTPTAIFWAAQAAFWIREVRRLNRPLIDISAASVALIAGLALIGCQVLSFPLIAAFASRLHWGEDALLARVADEEALESLLPSLPLLRERAALLEHYGMSLYATPEVAWLGQPLSKAFKPGIGCIGSFDVVVRAVLADSNAVRAEGWAWDKIHFAPVRRIILANDRGVITGFASGGVSRPDIPANVRAVWTPYAGWRGLGRSQGGTVHAYAILPGGRACELGQKSSRDLPGGFGAQSTAVGQPGPALLAAVSLVGGLTPMPAPASAGPPPPGEMVYASGSGADSGKGEIIVGPFRSRTGAVAFGMATGSDPAFQTLTLKDAETGAVLAQGAAPLTPAWIHLSFNLPPQGLGRPLLLVVSDQGAAGSQWIAITAPHDSPAATSTAARISLVGPGKVGPAISAGVTADPAWTLGGAPAAAGARLANARAYGSWSGADVRQGVISFGPFRTTAPDIALGLTTGPDPGGQVLLLKDADTQATLSAVNLDHRPTWGWVRLHLPPDAAGRPLLLQGVDRGGGRGEWMGLTEPHLVAPPTDTPPQP